MRSKWFILISVILGIIIFFAPYSFAAMPDANNVKQVHVGATVGCTLCHPEGNFKGVK